MHYLKDRAVGRGGGGAALGRCCARSPHDRISHGHHLLAKVGAVVDEAADDGGMQPLALHPHHPLGLRLLQISTEGCKTDCGWVGGGGGQTGAGGGVLHTTFAANGADMREGGMAAVVVHLSVASQKESTS